MASTTKKTSAVRQILTDPLFHFLIVGAAVFGIYSTVLTDSEPNLVSLPEGEVLEFVNNYRTRFGKNPDDSLIEEFRQNWLSEEVLFQEGVRLGLIYQDPVVRQRIVNKMQVVLAENTPEQEPDDETLKAFLNQVQEQYIKPASYSFETAMVSGGMAMPSAVEQEAYADLLLRALNNGAEPKLAGVPYRIHHDQNAAAVRALWGMGFTKALSALKVEDGWRRLDSKRGPVLVKLVHIEEGKLPSFDAIRGNLLMDWKRQQQAAAVRGKVAKLRKGYQVSWQGEQ